jgi:hypothetical protein
MECNIMPFIQLYENRNNFPTDITVRDPVHPHILIFTEGTVLGPKYWWEFFNDKGYVPIGTCVAKISGWEAQGARIAYLTSRRQPADVAAIREILRENGFPGSRLFFRGEGEEYRHVAEEVIPDVLIEDDCRSIGGSRNWTITYVKPDIKSLIHSIIVREFGGIDHLPDEVSELLVCKSIPSVKVG